MRLTGRCALFGKGHARAVRGLALTHRPGEIHIRGPFSTDRAGWELEGSFERIYDVREARRE